MTRPNILPGKREVSFSHGHAYIKRDGDIFATVTPGRDGHGMHAEGVHLSVADEAKAIAAVPALLEALETADGAIEQLATAAGVNASAVQKHIRSALIAAGYQF